VPPEPPKASGPAREIRLTLGGGDQRVEVKLTDRGGELQVGVRTADGQLAGRLRENLPALTTRLAESGMRAETWHPGASTGSGSQDVKETSPANSGDPSDPQPRQDGRKQDRENQPRQPQAGEENDQRKEKRKDFTWLMSTLR
jgi:flagellar hook-length control protein FliK